MLYILIGSDTVLFVEIAHSRVILKGAFREKIREISNNPEFGMVDLFGGF